MVGSGHREVSFLPSNGKGKGCVVGSGQYAKGLFVLYHGMEKTTQLNRGVGEGKTGWYFC